MSAPSPLPAPLMASKCCMSCYDSFGPRRAGSPWWAAGPCVRRAHLAMVHTRVGVSRGLRACTLLAAVCLLTRAHLFPTPACCCLCGGRQVTVFLEGCVATHTHVSTVSPTASLCIVRRTGHPLLSCPAVPFFLPPHLPVSWLGRQDEVGPIHSDLVIPTFAPSQPNLVDLAVACACR